MAGRKLARLKDPSGRGENSGSGWDYHLLALPGLPGVFILPFQSKGLVSLWVSFSGVFFQVLATPTSPLHHWTLHGSPKSRRPPPPAPQIAPGSAAPAPAPLPSGSVAVTWLFRCSLSAAPCSPPQSDDAMAAIAAPTPARASSAGGRAGRAQRPMGFLRGRRTCRDHRRRRRLGSREWRWGRRPGRSRVVGGSGAVGGGGAAGEQCQLGCRLASPAPRRVLKPGRGAVAGDTRPLLSSDKVTAA